MFGTKDYGIYKAAVRHVASLCHGERIDAAAIVSGLDSLLEKHFPEVSVYSWMLAGGVPSAAYPEKGADDLYVDEVLSSPDIPVADGSRGYFGNRRTVYYSVFGASEGLRFVSVLEFREAVPEKTKDGIISLSDSLWRLAVPALPCAGGHPGSVKAAYDWSAVAYAVENSAVGLVAYVRPAGLTEMVVNGYGKVLDLYSGWTAVAHKVFGEDAVCSLDADSLVIACPRRDGLAERLAEFQNRLDEFADGNGAERSVAAFASRERCTYADVVSCRERIMHAEQDTGV